MIEVKVVGRREQGQRRSIKTYSLVPNNLLRKPKIYALLRPTAPDTAKASGHAMQNVCTTS